MSALMAAFSLTMLFRAWRVTPRISAARLTVRPSEPLLAELSMGAILSRLLAQAAPFGDRRPLPAANHHSSNDPGDPRLPGDRRRRFERKSDGVRECNRHGRVTDENSRSDGTESASPTSQNPIATAIPTIRRT